MNPRQRSRSVQHGWEALRSQLMAHFTRGEAPQRGAPAPEVKRRAFRLENAEPYYGPTREAREAINRVLGLDASAGQQDWEQAIGVASNLQSMVEALGDACADTEARSAIALLLLDWVDRLGMSAGPELLARIRWQLRRDTQVQARMRYWWTHMEGGPAVMEALG